MMRSSIPILLLTQGFLVVILELIGLSGNFPYATSPKASLSHRFLSPPSKMSDDQEFSIPTRISANSIEEANEKLEEVATDIKSLLEEVASQIGFSPRQVSAIVGSATEIITNIYKYSSKDSLGSTSDGTLRIIVFGDPPGIELMGESMGEIRHLGPWIFNPPREGAESGYGFSWLVLFSQQVRDYSLEVRSGKTLLRVRSGQTKVHREEIHFPGKTQVHLLVWPNKLYLKRQEIRDLLELNRRKFLNNPKEGWSEANLKEASWAHYWRRLLLTTHQSGQESVISLRSLMNKVDQQWGGIPLGKNGLLLLLDEVQLITLDEERKAKLIQKSERIIMDLDEIFQGDDDQVRKNLINLIEANREQFLKDTGVNWTEGNLQSLGHEWPNVELKTKQTDPEEQIYLLPLLLRANNRWGGIKRGTNGVKIFLHQLGLLKLSPERLATLSGEGKLPSIDLGKIFNGDDNKVRGNLRGLFKGNRRLFLNDPEGEWVEGNLKKATWRHWETIQLKKGKKSVIQLRAIIRRAKKRWPSIKRGTHGMKELFRELWKNPEDELEKLLLAPL